MRIVVTGASGLLGGRIASLLGRRHAVTGIVRSRLGPLDVPCRAVDLADEGAFAGSIRGDVPDAIVHCAALADGDACEQDPQLAERNNEMATRNVASACRDTGARLIAISTDLVFDGASSLVTEESATRPLSEYGRSKLRAEEIAAALVSEAVILRVALVHGQGHGARRSASESIADRLSQGRTVRLFDDEWRSPVDAESVGFAIEGALRFPLARGCFHIGGSTRLTRFDLGELVAKTLGLDPGLLERASQSSHRGAPRPKDASMSINRARSELGYEPRPIEVGIREGRIDRSTSAAP